jgi:deoxyribodipyrimidine photo-lyase
MKISVFWFRRDLRLKDNTALHHALNSDYPVLPIFIFDQNILEELPPDDARVQFIYSKLIEINQKLLNYGSSILILNGDPVKEWRQLISTFDIAHVYINKDYEPYARIRDKKIRGLLEEHNIQLQEFKDQVIFEENEIVKDDGLPYTVYTPYKNKWLKKFNRDSVKPLSDSNSNNFYSGRYSIPYMHEIGFSGSNVKVRDFDLSQLDNYATSRDLPALDATSYLSPHLRFGTVSIRQVIDQLRPGTEVFLSELIWREFFMQVLFHFPEVVNHNFKEKYDGIKWRNDKNEFEKWCRGKTGYPMVDAGMRQLNATGYMHNRVRMVTASFLCKHLLIDWRWGEAYFAKKLLDYELSSNNGNWQWAAGTGCDAAPYFRVFNPTKQLAKFDRTFEYVRKWVPEFDTSTYIDPIVDHKFARQRALEAYKSGLIDVQKK